MDNSSKWKTPILLIGGVAGLAFGLGAAYLYIQSVEVNQGGPRQIKPASAMSLGLSLLVLLKQIAGLGTEE